MTEQIAVLTHSSIRIGGETVVYIDPYQIEEARHDADVILITHEHFDHFSIEDIAKVKKPDTVLVVPQSMQKKAAKADCTEIQTVKPGEKLQVRTIPVETIAAYNNLKPFHPKHSAWVGYILEIGGNRIYVAGDTDVTKENTAISCDVALVPIGGKFTMDAKEAAKFINTIKPKVAIPTHYGSVAGTKEAEEVFKAAVDPGIAVEIKMQKY